MNIVCTAAYLSYSKQVCYLAR